MLMYRIGEAAYNNQISIDVVEHDADLGYPTMNFAKVEEAFKFVQARTEEFEGITICWLDKSVNEMAGALLLALMEEGISVSTYVG